MTIPMEVTPSREDDECRNCWYCATPLSPRHEHDHFIPQAVGGELVVPACINCHDLKDRVPLADWDISVVVGALLQVPEAGMARLLFAKMLSICCHGEALGVDES